MIYYAIKTDLVICVKKITQVVDVLGTFSVFKYIKNTGCVRKSYAGVSWDLLSQLLYALHQIYN